MLPDVLGSLGSDWIMMFGFIDYCLSVRREHSSTSLNDESTVSRLNQIKFNDQIRWNADLILSNAPWNHESMIFIGGCGAAFYAFERTNPMQHPDVNYGLNREFTLRLTNHVAHNENKNRARFWIAAVYLKLLASTNSRLICEKTHPSIWVKHKMDRLFPKALWVCVTVIPTKLLPVLKKKIKWVNRDEQTNYSLLDQRRKSKAFQTLNIGRKGRVQMVVTYESDGQDSPKCTRPSTSHKFR